MYQMNIPRLWEAHRGFRVLQSAHMSGGVGRKGRGKSAIMMTEGFGPWSVLDRVACQGSADGRVST